MKTSFIYTGMAWIFFMAEFSHGDNQIALSFPDNGGEYCLSEEFQASCLKNEIVIVEEATFGRMNVGRCLQNVGAEILARNRNDPKFFGCSVDVKNLIADKCFGKYQCTVRVLHDIDQKVTKTCHDDLQSYLQTTYSCASVVEPDRSCTVSVTSTAQHLMISPSSPTKLSCGSRHQPWKLEAPVGQQINVSLLDFGGAVNQGENDCLQYGYIIDKDDKRNVSMCTINKRSNKLNLQLQSKSNTLEIIFGDLYMYTNESKPLHKILVRVAAVGCSYFVPPEDMWLRRRNQEAVVGCYSSRQTWYLNCVNHRWLGVIGNCTRELPLNDAEITDNAHAAKNHVLVAVSIAVIGVIICVAIVVCGFICMKRYTSMIAKAGSVNNAERMHNGGWQTGSCNKTFMQQNRQLI